jgi:AcrR family transcriptional regulator
MPTRTAASPATGDRPLRRDADENRRRVLAAAAEVFAVQGLDAPVEAIAQAAGVGMGTLYRRFPTKEALIEQLVSDLFESVLEAGRRALEAAGGHGLETFLRHTARLQQTHRGCVSRLWESPLPEAFLVELDQILALLLAQAQSAGLIRGDCVPTDLTVLMWASRGLVEATNGSAPQAWERHLDIVMAGLRPGAAPLEHPPLSQELRVSITRARQPPR